MMHYVIMGNCDDYVLGGSLACLASLAFSSLTSFTDLGNGP